MKWGAAAVLSWQGLLQAVKLTQRSCCTQRDCTKPHGCAVQVKIAHARQASCAKKAPKSLPRRHQNLLRSHCISSSVSACEHHHSAQQPSHSKCSAITGGGCSRKLPPKKVAVWVKMQQVPAAGGARKHWAVTFCTHARISPRQITRFTSTDNRSLTIDFAVQVSLHQLFISVYWRLLSHQSLSNWCDRVCPEVERPVFGGDSCSRKSHHSARYWRQESHCFYSMPRPHPPTIGTTVYKSIWESLLLMDTGVDWHLVVILSSWSCLKSHNSGNWRGQYWPFKCTPLTYKHNNPPIQMINHECIMW